MIDAHMRRCLFFIGWESVLLYAHWFPLFCCPGAQLEHIFVWIRKSSYVYDVLLVIRERMNTSSNNLPVNIDYLNDVIFTYDGYRHTTAFVIPFTLACYDIATLILCVRFSRRPVRVRQQWTCTSLGVLFIPIWVVSVNPHPWSILWNNGWNTKTTRCRGKHVLFSDGGYCYSKALTISVKL